MERTKKDYHKLVNETVEFYGQDSSRRATTKVGQCQYITKDGTKRCAVGRCMTKSALSVLGQRPLDIYNAIREYRKEGGSIDELLKKKYRGYTNVFWGDLQYFHDIKAHFDESGKGLTLRGERLISTIKRNIENDYYAVLKQ